jgi:hypothetical protein
MTEQDLYQIYSRWTGQLHFYAVRELGEHLDCEYFPGSHQFKVYSGWAEEYTTAGGIPGLSRPLGERVQTIDLYRPEDNPSPDQLDQLFKEICLAGARVLGIQPGRKALPELKIDQDQDGTPQKRLEPGQGNLRLRPAPGRDPGH